jgi:hypothetical protein
MSLLFIHDGTDNEVVTLHGSDQTIADQMDFSYQGGTDAHYNVDRIDTFSAELLFSCENEFGRMVKSEGEDYRVVSSSIILGAMANGYALNLKQYLMGEIVNYFLGYDPVTSILDPNTETQLAGNFPNPFSSETTITVNLEQPGVVLVEIFNASGQKIKTITEEVHLPGDFAVVWNGKDESGNQAKNGQYFYRISNGTQQIFNTMILIR